MYFLFSYMFDLAKRVVVWSVLCELGCFRNNLEDIVQVQYLAICSRLTNLTLDGNPLCNEPSPGTLQVRYL